jgi:hypothetical protein
MNKDRGVRIALSRKAVIALILVVLAGGGLWGWWQHVSNPPKPWLVKWRINRYLKQQTGRSDFSTDFPLPSKRAMAAPPRSAAAPTNAPAPKGQRTGKEFEALKDDYITMQKEVLTLERQLAETQSRLAREKARLPAPTAPTTAPADPAGATNPPSARSESSRRFERVADLEKDVAARRQALAARQQALEPIRNDLADIQSAWAALRPAPSEAFNDPDTLPLAWAAMQQAMRERLDAGANYRDVYVMVGEQLWVANWLSGSANPDHRRLTLTIARRASHDALDEAQNGWLAARICEAYLWPHLDVATDPNRRSPLNLENVLEDCANVFRQNDEIQNAVRGYELFIARTTNAHRADWARVQMAEIHQRAGAFAQAVACLKQVQMTNDYAWALRRLPWLEQRARSGR